MISDATATAHRTVAALAAALGLLTHHPAHAQGTLEPRSAPAPSMKSLQQIWDKISTLETTVTDQRTLLDSQQQLLLQQSTMLSAQARVLADIGSNSGSLWEYIDTGIPWTGASRIDGAAYLPDGRLAILTGNEFHIQEGTGWQSTTISGPSAGGTLLIDALSQVQVTFLDNDGLYQTTRNSAGTWSSPAAFGPRVQPGNSQLSSARGADNRSTHAYVADGGDSIRIAWINGFTFHSDIAEEEADLGVPVTFSLPSVSFNPTTGHPTVAYFAQFEPSDSSPTVRYAEFDGTSWQRQRIDYFEGNRSEVEGYGLALAQNPLNGHPAVLYQARLAGFTDPTTPVADYHALNIWTGTTWRHERHSGYVFPVGLNPPRPDIIKTESPTHLLYLDDGTTLLAFRRHVWESNSLIDADLVLGRLGANGSIDYSAVMETHVSNAGLSRGKMVVSPDNRVVFVMVWDNNAFAFRQSSIRLAISRLPLTP